MKTGKLHIIFEFQGLLKFYYLNRRQADNITLKHTNKQFD